MLVLQRARKLNVQLMSLSEQLTVLHIDVGNVVPDATHGLPPTPGAVEYWRSTLRSLVNLKRLSLVLVEDRESLAPKQFMVALFEELVLPKITHLRLER